MSASRFQVTVDRINGIWAVLEIKEKGLFEFPRDLLPENTQEGQCLTFTIEHDPESQEKQRERIKSLRQRLIENRE